LNQHGNSIAQARRHGNSIAKGARDATGALKILPRRKGCCGAEKD
jgi:hypothetical protein